MADASAVDCLDPKNDLVFKLLLTREPALLRDMLEAVLGRPVRDATVLNPGIPGELPLDRQLQIHLIQLSMLSSSAVGYADPRLARWARFLMAQDDAARDQLASEDPIMALARKTLDQLSQDPETRRLAREREDSLRLYDMHLAASREEGKAEGRAGVLLELLEQRFGSLPATTRARVEAATAAELDAWIGRVLTATTLDEALAP